MNSKLVTSAFIIGTLIAPAAAFAEDMDKDRSQPKTFVKDSVITTKIKANLAKEKLSSLKHIKVDTDSKGEVMMSGYAESQAQIDQAIAIARATEGVTSVKSSIQVKMDK